MKLKPLLIFVGLLAVASLVTYFLGRPKPPPPADARIGQPVVDSATLQQAAAIRIYDGGRSVEIVRDAGANAWKVPSYHNLPASFPKIADFLGDFADAKIERLVTTNPERLARLGFDDSRVEIADASGRLLWRLLVGTTTREGGAHVRYGDEAKAYFATLRAYLDVEAVNWTDQQLIKLSDDDVARVEIALPGEAAPVVATRSSKDAAFQVTAAPAGRRPISGIIPAVVTSLSGLRFTDSAAPDSPDARAARESGVRKYALTTFAGETYTIEMASKPRPAELAAGDAKAGAEAAAPGAIAPAPVFAWVTSSNAAAPVNALMKLRTFQISEYVASSLPAKLDDLFEPVSPAAAAATPAGTP